jgi:hypothetical protein
MCRLAGARLFALTVAHRVPVRDFYVPVPCMRACAQCLQSALQFLTTLSSFLTFFECCGINLGPWMTSSLFDDVEFLQACADKISVITDPSGYRWPPTFSNWLKTTFWQFWQFTIFSRF